jgi:DNA processing protein
MAATDADRLARVALSRLGEPGDLRLTGLVAELGAELVRDLLGQQRSDGLPADVAVRLAEVDPEAELERAAKAGLRFVVPGDDEWPARLDDLHAVPGLHDRGGVPVGLWVRGSLRLSTLGGSVAVVGSRAATGYGESVAGDIGAGCGYAGVPVVSGAAFGIDAAAHRGALAAGAPSVAVLACGADRTYPAAHRRLIDEIADAGAVVSEAAPGCSPLRIRFLARNRLIAALTRGTVVAEAALRSGALNTANWATRLNRPLMGVPGPVTSAPSAGVHDLIRQGAMTLVTSAADVLELVGAAGEHLVERRESPQTRRDALTARGRQVLDAVPVASRAPVDSIARVAGVGLLEVRAVLGRLHAAGLVDVAPTGWRLTPTVSDP